MSSINTPSSFSETKPVESFKQYNSGSRFFNGVRDGSIKQEYILPTIREVINPDRVRKNYSLDKIRTEPPKRLDSPLVPYMDEMIEYLKSGDDKVMIDIQASHHSMVRYIRNSMIKLLSEYNILDYEFNHDMGLLKKLIRNQFSVRASRIHTTSYSLAIKAADRDLKVLCPSVDNEFGPLYSGEDTISFFFLIQRIRPMMVMKKGQSSNSKFEAGVVVGDHGERIVTVFNNKYSYIIFMFGTHFALWHSNSKEIFVGPMTYLDYMYTICDVINNSTLISSQSEYSSFKDLIDLLNRCILRDYDHNKIVTYFKAYETFCLFIADMKTHTLVNWEPVMDTLLTMREISNELSESKISKEEALYYITSTQATYDHNSLLGETCSILMKLTELELLEASALHKFVFFAEIRGMTGIHKFLKRVHTKRVVDPINERQLVSSIKKEFTVNYTKKSGLLPNIISPIEKVLRLNQMMKENDISSVDAYGLSWWDDVQFGKTLEYVEGGNPVEYAKDKGAIKYDITFGPKDSEKELVTVMSREDYKEDDFLKDISTEPIESDVYITTTSENPQFVRFPVRQCLKEKEPKPEGRIFGVAPAQFKHQLSKYMSKCKIFLNYLDEQSMTMTDKARKGSHHEMAQDLADDSLFAVMMDIEGHNQSMQPDNYSNALGLIGNIFGEDDWYKLAYLFKNLTVYFYNDYSEKVIVSKGQFGGIEGWMNPVWTMITLQQLKLLRYNTTLTIPKNMCYSDDVVSIVKLPLQTQGSIDIVLNTISREFHRLGFLVKASQSAVSKYRITLLRQHSIKGLRADSTLKRLLSCSTANNARICADEIEVSAISSVCSSAMDCTYHLRTCMLMKWYKTFFFTSYLIGSLLEERRNDSLISPTSLGPRISSILYNIDGPQLHELVGKEELMINNLKEREMRECDMLGHAWGPDHFRDWMRSLQGDTFEGVLKKRIPDLVLYLSLEDDLIFELWMMILLMPVAIGGCGVELCINQSISGNSDSLLKSLYYIKIMINSTFVNKSFCYDIIRYSLKIDTGAIEELRIGRLIQSKWVTNPAINRVTDSINNKLIGVMRRLTKNKELLNVLDKKVLEKPLMNHLVSLFATDFNHRVCQFYFENSITSMIQFLLKKLETSTSLINKIKDVADFKQVLTVRTRRNILLMLGTTGHTFGAIDNECDILSYLQSRRKTIFPSINFTDIEEPLYDEILSEVPSSEGILNIMMGTPMRYANGRATFKAGLFESSTLYKGELLDEDVIMKTREEMLVAKLVAVTKWAMLKTYPSVTCDIIGHDYNFTAACRASMSTLTDKPLEEIVNMVPLETGGEIFHRLPGQQFKSKISTKILPNHTQYISTHLNQTNIIENNLEDSNINFEYIRMRFLLMYSYRYRYTGWLPTFETFGFIKLNNIVDVRDYTPKLILLTDTIPFDRTSIKLGKPLNYSRVALSSTAYLYEDDLQEVLTNINHPARRGIKAAVAMRDEELVYNYFKNLDKEFLLLDYGISNKSYWEPLIRKLSDTSLDFRSLSGEDRINYIELLLKKRLHEIHYSTKYKDYRKKYMSRLRDLKSLGGVLDKNYISLKAKVFLSRDDDPITAADKIGRMAFERLDKNIRFAMASLIKDLCLGYGLILKLIKDNIVIDVTMTYENVYGIIESVYFNENIPWDIRTSCLWFGIDRLRTFMMGTKNDILRFLKNVGKLAKEKYIFPTAGKVKFPITRVSINNVQYSPELDQVVYSSYYFSLDELIDPTFIKNTNQTCRRITELYGHPQSLNSMTGSDSLMAQVGLLRQLLLEGIITDSNSVTSLASGRGDICFAADYLNIHINAYSKPVLFSKMGTHPKVNLDYDFDLSDYSTIIMDDLNYVILIDLSFIEGPEKGIKDTILEFISRGHLVIIRSSVFKDESSNFVEELIKLKVETKYYYPTSNYFIPYQQYISFRINEHDEVKLGIPLQEELGYLMMMDHYVSHIDYVNMMTIPTDRIENSISHMIDPELSTKQIVMSLDRSTYHHYRLNAIRSIIRRGNVGNIIGLNTSSYYYLIHGEDEQQDISIVNEGPNIWEGKNDDDCGYRKQRGYYHWTRALTEMKEYEEDIVYIDISNSPIHIISKLGRVHPLKEIRSYIKNYLIFREDGLDVSLMNDVELDELNTRESLDDTSVDTSLSNNVRTVLAIIIKMAIQGTYKEGLRMLLPSIRDSTDEKNRSHSRVVIYRKLSWYFYHVRDTIRESGLQLKDIELIDKHIVSPRRQLKIKKIENESEKVDDLELKKLRESVITNMTTFIERLATGSIPIMPSELIGGTEQSLIDLSKETLFNDVNHSNIIKDREGEGVDDDPGVFDPGTIIGKGLAQMSGFTNELFDLMNQYADQGGSFVDNVEEVEWDGWDDVEEEDLEEENEPAGIGWGD